MTDKKTPDDRITLLKKAVVVVMGAHNTGKSTFALTSVLPDDLGLVFYHDAERSANRAIEELERQGLAIGKYIDLEARFSKTKDGKALPSQDDLLTRINSGNLPWASDAEKTALIQYWHSVKQDVYQQLEQDKYKVYIHDTIVTLEAGMAAWVESHKGIGEGKAGWLTYGYGKMWTEGVYPLYRGFIQGIFDRGVDLIILVAHLKSPWFGEGKNAKRIPGKVEPQGKPVLKLISSLMIWLTQSLNPDGAPAGIIFKERLGKIEAVKPANGGKRRWRNRRMLPLRIPHCTWWQDPDYGELGSIEYYLEHGCDLTQPKAGETLSKQEQDMIGHTLTDAQMRYMIAEAETNRALAQKDLVSRGVAVPVIDPAKALKDGQGELTISRTMIDSVKGLITKDASTTDLPTLKSQIVGSAPIPLQVKLASAFDLALTELEVMK